MSGFIKEKQQYDHFCIYSQSVSTLFEMKNAENMGLAFSQKLLRRHTLTGKDSKINNFV